MTVSELRYYCYRLRIENKILGRIRDLQPRIIGKPKHWSSALMDLLRRRLDDHDANPASGVRWETLRDRLLKRQHA
jgi:putative addiction module component (TIGR02574 family)